MKSIIDKVSVFWSIAKWVIIGFLLALAILAFLFLKTHWKGFTNFLKDPAFFDNVKIERDYQLKK